MKGLRRYLSTCRDSTKGGDTVRRFFSLRQTETRAFFGPPGEHRRLRLRLRLPSSSPYAFPMMPRKQKDVLERLAQIFHGRQLLIQQGLAECLGTLVLVVSHRCRSCSSGM